MNANVPAVATTAGEIMESVLLKGDLGKLTEQERTNYYLRVCESLGLNPLTQPFQYLALNGKLVLYARRDAADQLRKINGISIEILSRSVQDNLLTVHVRAKDKTGRTDEDFGVVNIGNLKGEAAANAALKAVTKAKRRVTLSISGLGFLDETEVEDIPAAERGFARRPAEQAAPIQPAAIEPPHDPATGEIGPHKIAVQEFQGGSNWLVWGGQFVAAIKTAKTAAEVDQWIGANSASIELLQAEAPKIHARVHANVETMLAKFKPAANAMPSPKDDPEGYFLAIKKLVDEAKDDDALAEIFLRKVEPQQAVGSIFPPDMIQIEKLFADKRKAMKG